MNIAAGVLLILAAIINGSAGSGYALGGAASSAAGVVSNKVGSEIAKQQVQEGKPTESDAAGSMQASSTTAETANNIIGLLAGIFALVAIRSYRMTAPPDRAAFRRCRRLVIP